MIQHFPSGEEDCATCNVLRAHGFSHSCSALLSKESQEVDRSTYTSNNHCPVCFLTGCKAEPPSSESIAIASSVGYTTLHFPLPFILFLYPLLGRKRIGGKVHVECFEVPIPLDCSNTMVLLYTVLRVYVRRVKSTE